MAMMKIILSVSSDTFGFPHDKCHMFLFNSLKFLRQFRSNIHKCNQLLTRSVGGMTEEVEEPPEFLKIDASSNSERLVAYRRVLGHRSPGVIFLPGYMSVMNGTKALRLASLCKQTGHSFVRFDYESIGESPGDFKDVTFDLWMTDVLTVFDELTSGPQVIVGSSMGVWFMLRVAVERSERIHGLIGCGSGINFSRHVYDGFPQEDKDRLDRGELVTLSGIYGDYLATKKFIDSFNANYIRTDRPLSISCPVRMIHAIEDELAPCETTVLLAKLIESKDVDIILRKDADHRVSDPLSLKALDDTLLQLLSHSGKEI